MSVRAPFLALLLLTGGGALRAQTTHVVNVTNFVFTPAVLTINEGDTVEWRNLGGPHNVRETTASNPAGFGNAISGDLWTYAFTFSRSGTFSYVCQVHAPSMGGRITVAPATAAEPAPASGFRLQVPVPNPFDRRVGVRLAVARPEAVVAAVHDVTGRRVAVLYEGVATPERTLALTWEPEAGVASGLYLLVVRGESFEATRPLTLAR